MIFSHSRNNKSRSGFFRSAFVDLFIKILVQNAFKGLRTFAFILNVALVEDLNALGLEYLFGVLGVIGT